MEEIKNQLKRIETQIGSEQRIHGSWMNYKDCPLKSVVLNQAIGVIRGLEIAKESLEYIMKAEADKRDQIRLDLPGDEWIARERELKETTQKAVGRVNEENW